MIRLLDNGLDLMSANTQRSMGARALVTAIAAAITAMVIGWQAPALWCAVMLAIEVWGRVARVVVFKDRAGSPAARLTHLLDAGAASLGWTALGWLLWTSGAAAGPVCAAALWLSVIYFGQTYALDSPIGLVVTGALPSLAMLVIVAAAPDPLKGGVGPVWALLALAIAFAAEGAARGLIARRRFSEVQGSVIDSEARYRVLADHVTDVISLTRMDGKRLYMSPSIEGLLGCSAEAMLSASNFDHIHPEDGPKIWERMTALAQRGGRETMEYRCLRRDGTAVWVETSFTVTDIGAAGDPPTLVSVTRDIGARKAMERDLIEARERAEQAARVKSDFLANMSHELRTPLNAIIGFSELLKSSATLGEREARQAALINDASATLLQIVNGVLDFSKLEAGAVELEAHPFDPLEQARAVAALVEDQAVAKGLALEVRGDGAGDLVLGDAPRLRQVLLNFVANALKFTSVGRVEITVSQTDARGGARRLRFEVADTGIGIPADQLDSVFERFTQADLSVSRRFGGTGLGLAICKHIIELMGGRIGATSAPGAGSTFWFELVLPRAAPKAASSPGATPTQAGRGRSAPSASAQDAGAAPGRPLRLLLAEDVEVNRELLLAVLQPFDIAIDTAVDGVHAVQAVEREDYDLILMDVQMPVMDGLTATARIRAMERPGARTAPIIAMTANVLPEQVKRCLDAGMNDHLGKPINPAKLIEAIERWAGGAPAAADARRAVA